MPTRSWQIDVAQRLLVQALVVLAYLFLCRALVVHYGARGADAPLAQLLLEATERSGMDALAVSIVTAAALIISTASATTATIFLLICSAYLMVAGAINVRVMDIYGQPATINLLNYGNFLDVDGMRSLAKYMTRVDKIMLPAAFACLAFLAATGLLKRLRLITETGSPKFIFPVALFALVALPAYGVFEQQRDNRGRDANAGWWLLKSAIATPVSAVQISHPDLRDPFETYIDAQPDRVATPSRVRQAHIRNVLIIVIESVGSEYLDLRSNGSPAPNIARLTASGAYFPNTYAAMPSSPMTLFSLMTGMYPPVSPKAIPMHEPEFPAPTLFERLGAAGKSTGVFSANWGFMDFERYFRGRTDHLEQVPDERNCGALLVSGDVSRAANQTVSSGAEECTFESTGRWIERSNKGFAALLWTYGTHYPYGAADPLELTGNSALARRLYLARITETDRRIGRLLADLARQGKLDDTLVVVVGDHGESFGEHGNRGHGNDIYQESVRVPLVFFNRRLFPKGVTDTSPVRVIDIAPTVLSLAGQAVPRSMQGLDLSSPLRPRRVFLAAAWLNLVMGYRDAAMKYDYAYVTDDLQAFDLAHDPHERVDLGPKLTRQQRTSVVRRLMNWKSAVDALADSARKHAER